MKLLHLRMRRARVILVMLLLLLMRGSGAVSDDAKLYAAAGMEITLQLKWPPPVGSQAPSVRGLGDAVCVR
jgi:hypothetical protein